MTDPKTVLTTVETVPWESLENPVTGKTMHRKMLHVDQDTGMEVFLVRYGPGVLTPRHTHPCSHGMYVLSGRLVTQKGVLHPGDFVWFEEGVVGEHGATDDEPTLALFITNKRFDIKFID